MIFKTKRCCLIGLLSLCVMGCVSNKQEERISSLESQAAGQYLLDIRVAKVEDRLTHIERRLQGDEVYPSRKKETVARQSESKSAAAGKKIEPIPAPVSLPRKIDPALSLAALNKSSVPSVSEQNDTAPLVPEKIPAQQPQDIAPKEVRTTTAKSGAVSVAPSALKKALDSDPKSVALLNPLDTSEKKEAQQKTLATPSAQASYSPPKESFTFAGLEEARANKEGIAIPRQHVDKRNLQEPKSRGEKKEEASAKTDRSLYNAALALYDRGNPKGALEMFSTFITTYPKSVLMPNALYWQGECHYSTGQYTAAIMKFKDVVERYPAHAKSAGAMLKIGYAYAQMKDMANARFYWELLLEDFPGSQPAVLAKKRLATL